MGSIFSKLLSDRVRPRLQESVPAVCGGRFEFSYIAEHFSPPYYGYAPDGGVVCSSRTAVESDLSEEWPRPSGENAYGEYHGARYSFDPSVTDPTRVLYNAGSSGCVCFFSRAHGADDRRDNQYDVVSRKYALPKHYYSQRTLFE